MIINSNDIFSQIGLAVDPNRRSNYNTRPKYVICLQIQLSEDEKHVLEVKDYDDPHLKAFEFCKQHKLNKLAIGIVQDKIREAMEFEQQKLIKRKQDPNSNNKKNKKLSPSKKESIQKSQKKKNKNESPSKSKNKKLESPDKTDNFSKSKSKSKLTKVSSSDNIYLRGLVKSRLLEQKKNKKKVQMQKKQEQQLTFKPKINNVSEKIVQFLRTNDLPKPKKSTPPKRVYDQMKQCTFKPKLNKVSQRIANNKSTLKEERQAHKQMFEEQTENKSRKTMESQQYSFKPQINPKSSQRVTVPFFKRLEIAQEKKNMALNKQSFYDDQQCSFQPKINRGPYKERNKENLNIWDYLYNGQKKQSVEQMNSGATQTTKENSTSQQYYQNLIDDRVTKVFQILDSNRDGLISPSQIAIENLPTQCLHFLKPIFIEMDEINATLNCYEFKKAVKALMADSDPGSKGAFITASRWKKDQQTSKQTFRPQINKRSKELSSNRSVENLYREGLKQKQRKQYILQKQRALRQQRQLMECSFKPVLNHSSKVYIDKISKRKQEVKENKSVSQELQSFMKCNDDQQ